MFSPSWIYPIVSFELPEETAHREVEEPGPGCPREQLISGECLPCQEMAVALRRESTGVGASLWKVMSWPTHISQLLA